MTKNLRYFFTLLLMAVVGVAWAQTTHTIGWGTASGDQGTYTNFTATSGEVAGLLSFTTEKNGAGTNPAYNSSNDELRLYYNAQGNGGSITITPASGVTITGAVMTTSTAPSVAYSVDGGSATSVTCSSNTYTISDISASSSLKIQNVNTANTQLRIKTIAITYTTSGSVPPSISAADVSINADATEGEIVYTLANAVEGGSMGASTTSDWLTLGTNFDSPISFTCNANDGAERTATVTLTYSYGDDQTVTKDVTVTQAEYIQTVSGYSIDFESVASAYTDWTFANMESQQTGNSNVTAHGGTYYGTTGGKASASITTKAKIATPNTLTCYVTKQTNNTTASNWKIEVSSDGAEWTTVKEQSATSMTAGTWVELTASLTSYTDVYVRVSYSGSTAIRNIDDLTLITEIPTSPLINAENPTELTYDATSGEIVYTITNPVPGTLLQAIADADWVSDITVGDEAITFTTTANELKTERVATFTLTYEGAEDKTVTVTQAGNPNIIDKIENISESGVPYNVQGTVVATSARAFVIGDGTGFIYTYLGSAPSWSVGDMVKISGTTSSYNQVIQFPNSATITVATESEYTPLTPAAMTEVPDYTSGLYKSDYYQFEGMLTKEGNYYVVAVGEGQIRISYPSTSQTTELDALLNKMVKVNGFFAGNSANGSGVFTAIMESIEEVVSDEPSITLASYEVEVNANAHTTPTTIAVTYANIDFENDVPEVVFYESDGSTETTYDWLFVDLDADWNVYYIIEENTNNAARTAYFKVLGYDSNGNNVYSNLASITQHQFKPDYAYLPYQFLGGKDDIENENGLTQEGLGSDYSGNNPKLRFDNAGDCLVLKINPDPLYEYSPKAITFNIKGNSFSGGTFAVQVSEDGVTYTDLATYTDSEITSSNQTFTLLNTNDNVKYIKWNYIYKDNGNVGIGNIYVDDEYLVKGNATVSEDLTLDECTIKESGKLTIKSGTLNVTNALTNEATSEAWNNLIIKDGGQLITTNAVAATLKKNIRKYEGEKDNYYLIATPVVAGTNAEAVAIGTYDLYSYDEPTHYWMNAEAEGATLTTLTNGTGYLYANAADQTLEFVGTMKARGSHPTATLTASATELTGFNLVGNPFPCNLSINDLKVGTEAVSTIYQIDNTEIGEVTVAQNTTIAPAEGFFVVATAGGTLHFEPQTEGSTANPVSDLLMEVRASERNAKLIDRAYVNFNQGSNVVKFQLNEANSKLYIPQGSKDYAVVRSQGEGELPVNFKADKNGAYTLSIRPENVEMDYLHLIDNLTGAEVDLLATPTYTFNAKKTDYASRFRLVFSTTGVEENGTETNASFAFFNGSEWVVNASDNATLEVVDMMGRIVAHGTRSVGTDGMAQGVYVLRLVDGNSVKTQKIVVR